MEVKNQTALDWLMNQLDDKDVIHPLILWKAKAMEKEQIIEANEDASTNEFGEFLTGEQYYNETYGK